MACINSDGTLTPSARKVLESTQIELTFIEVVESTGLPRYRIRASLRELNSVGLIAENGDSYLITEEGKMGLAN